MTLAEALDTTHIHSVAGRTGDRTTLVTTRPCRAPHHTVSDAGRIGGSHVPMPREVSRAHHGLHCLDERPECRRYVLEGWRPPSRGESYAGNLPHVIGLLALAGLALQTQHVSRRRRRGALIELYLDRGSIQ
jgi:Magnesium chelatase, subunit ChlI